MNHFNNLYSEEENTNIEIKNYFRELENAIEYHLKENFIEASSKYTHISENKITYDFTTEIQELRN